MLSLRKIIKKKSIAEFEKIKNISPNAVINLWFEDDLFCQTNLWFIAHFLCQFTDEQAIYLIRPDDNMNYVFASMNEQALEKAYQNKQELSQQTLGELSKMWQYYQAKDLEKMLKIAQNNNEKLGFLEEAAKAHIDRVLNQRPQKALSKIIKELQTKDFAKVFPVFNRQERIYGFGDMQVKRIFDKLIEQN